MAELKQGFERLDYTDVKTYLNSGNVIFLSDEADTIKTTSRIEEMIKNQFSLDIPVFTSSGPIYLNDWANEGIDIIMKYNKK